MSTTHRPFVVCLHDVAPCAEEAVMEQLAALHDLVGQVVSAALIPSARGPQWQQAGHDFIEALTPLDLLLHGYSHARPPAPSPISTLCGHVDELVGLVPAEVAMRLRAGQDILQAAFGRAARGFVPPAWRPGALDVKTAGECGLTFVVGFGTARDCGGHGSVRLATRSYDWGPLAWLGGFGSALGRLAAMRRGSLDVVALHPCDAQRGYLTSALNEIRTLLRRGGEPTTFRTFLETT